MSTKEQAHYYKVGLFVIGSIALLIALLIFFDNFSFLKKEITFETYFNESVQGLSVGSPVKYRGITVGEVKKISFVNLIYDLPRRNTIQNRYIYVSFVVTSSFLTKISPDKLKNNLQHAIASGLRVKLALQDLTGNAYLEVNYVDPQQNPVLPIYWKPENLYIPSAMSVLTKFSDNVQNLLQQIQAIDIPELSKNTEVLIANTNALVINTNRILAKNQSALTSMIQNANQSFSRLNNLLSATQTSLINTLQNTDSVTNNMRQVSNTLKNNPASIMFNRPQPIDPNNL